MSEAQDRPYTSAAEATKDLISNANITDQQASGMSEEEIVATITSFVEKAKESENIKPGDSQ